jgi:hypothetical protein
LQQITVTWVLALYEPWGVEVAQQDPETELDSLASQLGGVLIENVDPNEIDLYPELIKAHRSSRKTASRKVDHPLAFGVGELVVALSPLIYEVAKVVIRFMIEEISEVLKNSRGNCKGKSLRLDSSASIWTIAC